MRCLLVDGQSESSYEVGSKGDWRVDRADWLVQGRRKRRNGMAIVAKK
jgi:hypothetical protein